ncbi:ABC transporter permease [Puia dinghuensis]|uniref:ABC transporter permease n=1 Tax=Puia dinghuensis TaxID=1792502 RepID=A0A8J2UH38_9BACT|nr:ABC transporter permease [Puia dinghuensis]GGB17062.1 ABC transporter permease [Puia dinghuensis]
MIRNYFKTALRNLWKNKGFSAINIVGLAIGLATCLLILIFVMDEQSYDRYNKNADRIYRLDGEIKFGGNHFILAVAPAPAGPTLLRDYPEVLKEVRFRMNGGRLVKKGNQNIKEESVVMADSTLFEVFTLPMIEGDPHTALKDARTVVITEKIAKKYFDATNVVGRTLMINDSIPYKVTGVIKDIPAQSHFHFDFFLSLTESEEAKRSEDAWLSNNFNTYLLLQEGTDPKRFAAKLNKGIITTYIAPLLRSAVNISVDDFFKAGNTVGFSLTPLTDIHLHSNKTAELDANGNIQYVYIFSAIAAFILLIACVNFMNLSTARSASRAKEVGIRKVLGSLRGNLISQFMMESVVVSFIAMSLALGLAYLLLPVFNQLSAKQMEIGLFSRPWLLPAMVGLVLIVGVLAGSYPALFLSAFRPILVLKGHVAAGFKTSWLRNSLVVFQFCISIFLLVGTAVIYRQLQYIHNRELGFNRDQVLVINNPYVMGDEARVFKEKLLHLPGVEGATMTGYLPTSDNRNDDAIFESPDLDIKKSISMQTWPVDDQYIPVLGMKLSAGRNFSRDMKTDSNAVIVNEAAVRLMQGQKPLESKLYEIDDLKTKKLREYHIIGVVKDFNFNSLREVVTPVMLFLRPDDGRMALRVHSGNIHRLVGQMEDEWRKMAPSQPFTYIFMDEEFNNIYRSEQRMGGISLSFSLLAIFIACLGLFGLTAYAAEQRTREIGIRKVLGASVGGIISLLSKDFLRLVLVAMAIAFPLAWWAMHRWLQDFAYRITIGWEIFGVAALLAMGIALMTVSFQAVKAALANPVRSLRSE